MLFRKIAACAALLLATLGVLGAVAPSAHAAGARWYATVGTKGTAVSYSAPGCQGSDGRIDYTTIFNMATPCHFGQVDVTAYRNVSNVWATTQLWVRKDARYVWSPVSGSGYTFRTFCNVPGQCGVPTIWYPNDALNVYHDATELWFNASRGYEYWVRTTVWIVENNQWVGKDLDCKIDAYGVITNQTR